MLDFVSLVLAKTRQASRIERAFDFARPLAAVEFLDGAIEIAVAHHRDRHVGGLAGRGHREVEMLHAGGDVGDDFCELPFAVAPAAVGEHPYGPGIFPDPVDAPGQLKFGAERGLQEAVDDLAVGKALLLGALARGDRGNFRCGRRRNECGECDAGEGDR
jgi:hypothetical protein